MTVFIDIVQAHLTLSPEGVDLEDTVWPELSALLQEGVDAKTAAHLLDIAAHLTGDGEPPPAAKKLVGVIAVLIQVIVAEGVAPPEDVEVLRRRSADVVGAPIGTKLPGQPPPPGALKVGPAAFAALRQSKKPR